MLIDSNTECSTIFEWGSVRRTEDSANRSSAKLQFSSVSDREFVSNQADESCMGDRLITPLTHPRSPINQQENTSELQALRQVAYLGEQQKQRGGSSIRKEAIVSLNVDQLVGNFAAPLSPLRERDLSALSELFLTDKMSAIEADVAQLLIRLQPEPCWEDDPFAFLREFL